MSSGLTRNIDRSSYVVPSAVAEVAMKQPASALVQAATQGSWAKRLVSAGRDGIGANTKKYQNT